MVLFSEILCNLINVLYGYSPEKIQSKEIEGNFCLEESEMHAQSGKQVQNRM